MNRENWNSTSFTDLNLYHPIKQLPSPRNEYTHPIPASRLNAVILLGHGIVALAHDDVGHAAEQRYVSGQQEAVDPEARRHATDEVLGPRQIGYVLLAWLGRRGADLLVALAVDAEAALLDALVVLVLPERVDLRPVAGVVAERRGHLHADATAVAYVQDYAALAQEYRYVALGLGKRKFSS